MIEELKTMEKMKFFTLFLRNIGCERDNVQEIKDDFLKNNSAKNIELMNFIF